MDIDLLMNFLPEHPTLEQKTGYVDPALPSKPPAENSLLILIARTVEMDTDLLMNFLPEVKTIIPPAGKTRLHACIVLNGCIDY